MPLCPPAFLNRDSGCGLKKRDASARRGTTVAARMRDELGKKALICWYRSERAMRYNRCAQANVILLMQTGRED